eukprot:5471334-Prymnesium_polylepis.1
MPPDPPAPKQSCTGALSGAIASHGRTTRGVLHVVSVRQAHCSWQRLGCKHDSSRKQRPSMDRTWLASGRSTVSSWANLLGICSHQERCEARRPR